MEARREEILETATWLFAEHGYSDAVTQALAEKLQVGKGTIYRSFPSKSDLFLAAADRVMRKMRERVDAAIVGITDGLERLERAVGTYLAFFVEHPEYVELLVQERAQFKDRKRPTYYEHREKNVVRWHEVLRSLIAEGRVRDIPPEQVTSALSDMVYGTMFTNYFTGQRKPPEEQARDLMDLLFRGILTESERRRRGVD